MNMSKREAEKLARRITSQGFRCAVKPATYRVALLGEDNLEVGSLQSRGAWDEILGPRQKGRRKEGTCLIAKPRGLMDSVRAGDVQVGEIVLDDERQAEPPETGSYVVGSEHEDADDDD